MLSSIKPLSNIFKTFWILESALTICLVIQESPNEKGAIWVVDFTLTIGLTIEPWPWIFRPIRINHWAFTVLQKVLLNQFDLAWVDTPIVFLIILNFR